jgi:Uri superfamily endonuclease
MLIIYFLNKNYILKNNNYHSHVDHLNPDQYIHGNLCFSKSKREFECDNYISNNFCSEAISNPNYSSLLDCYATNKREVFLLGGLSLWA